MRNHPLEPSVPPAPEALGAPPAAAHGAAGARASAQGRGRRLRAGRVALVLAVLALGLSVVGGAHLYVAQRLVLAPGIGEPFRTGLLALVGALFASIVAEPFAERLLPLRWRRRVCGPVYAWLGILWITVNVLLVTDLAHWLMGAAATGAGVRVGEAARAATAVAIVAAASVVGVRGALRLPAVRRVEVRLPRWPAALDGLRIAQLSDIHIGPLLGRDFAAGLVERANALGADLVAVTGDLVDGSVHHLKREVAPFGELSAPMGVYFVTGNHDVYSGGEAWADHVAELGLRVLRNERVTLERGGARFHLAGVDDHRGDWVHGSSEDLDAALAGREPELPVVLLAHDPSTFVRAATLGVDLQLSGHTHGGQIWPFNYLVRLAVPFVAGLYRRGESQLYVSRGSGFWGPPLRLLAPAEITEITLRAGS